MMQCPKCKTELLDDSKFCDKCGEKLMFCPKCADGQPRRGKRCTQCGSLLTDTPSTVQSTQQPSKPEPPKPPKQQADGNAPEISMDDMAAAFAKAFGRQHGSEAPRSREQAGGTMRPGAQQGGTMRPTAAPDEPSRLVMVDNPAKVVVLKNRGIIGRTSGDYVDVFGACPYVSGTHAELARNSDGSWLLRDLGSTNGIKYGNFAFEPNKYYRIKKGMVLEIGFVKFRVE